MFTLSSLPFTADFWHGRVESVGETGETPTAAEDDLTRIEATVHAVSAFVRARRQVG
jgi:hypothetical protein